MKFLLAGLGNPGAEYAHTRHNIGFDVVNAFVQKHGGQFRSDRLALVADVKWKGKNFVCVCPTTYMNLSGKAVKYWLDKEKLTTEQLLVVVDDLANQQYPMPMDAHEKDEVFVGRLRRDESQPNTLNLWVVSDNLRKGAATNAVQIAEYLNSKGLLG